MSRLDLRALFAASLLLLTAVLVASCAGSPLVTEVPDSAGPKEGASQEAPPPAPVARPVVFLGADSELFAVVPDGSAARSLGVHVLNNGAGSIDKGGSAPVVSWDGRWVAALSDDDLVVVAVADGTAHRVTHYYPEKHENTDLVKIMISGWSPDSSRLMVYVDAGLTDESGCQAPDASPTLGFYTVSVDGWELTHQPAIEGFSGWDADGEGVVFSLYRAKDDYALMRYPFGSGDGRVLRTSQSGYGFLQLHVVGPDAVWIEHDTIVRAPLSSAAPATEASPAAPFASQQWPRLAPDRAHVAFVVKEGTTESLTLARGGTTEPATLGVCAGRCEFGWYSAETLVVSDNDGVHLVGLDGSRNTLAPNGELVPIGVH